MPSQTLKNIIFSFILTLNALAVAQNTPTQWWGNYTYNYDISEQWQFSTRLEMRYTSLADKYYRSGIGPAVKYKANHKLKYIAGCRLFYYDTDSKSGVWEYRPWLGIKYAHPSSNALSISHKALWEHRIYGHNVASYQSRLRYKFKISSTLIEHNDRTLKVAFAPELFCSLGPFDTFIYKNTRWGIPISYQWNQNMLMEVVPFIQTNHNGIFGEIDEHFGVIQLNLKTFL